MGIVRGRALFVRRWSNIPGAGESASAFARAYQAAGFEWAAVLCGWGDDTNVNRNLDHWHALADLGIDVWAVWGLPTPSTSQAAVGARADALLRFARQARAVGFMPDPEKKDGDGRDLGWHAHPDRARVIASKARNSGLRYGVTSYGRPSVIRNFDLRPWLDGADLLVPQTYDANGAESPDYAVRALEDYRRLGADPAATYAMGVGTWNKRRHRAKTIPELTRHMALTPNGPIIAWPYGTLTAAEIETLTTAPLGGAVRVRGGGGRHGGGGAALAAILAMLAGVAFHSE